MHISDVKRMQAEKDHLMRHEGKHPANVAYYDRHVLGKEDEERRNFANKEGDYDNQHLALKRKKAESEDEMPSIDQAYESTERHNRFV